VNHCTAVNILDMVNAIGEDTVQRILSDFSCQKNSEIETVEFSKITGISRVV
jgi:hypothetical protein